MINWFLVVLAPLGILLGMEYARRKRQADNDIYAFQPLKTHYLLNTVILVMVVLFVESALASLSNPDRFNVWMLILSGASGQVAMTIWSSNEITYAKRRLQKSSAENMT